MDKRKITTKDGRALKIGDKVIVRGEISLSEKVLYVTEQMREIINKGNEYILKDIVYHDDKKEWMVHVAGWWWAATNIFRTDYMKEEKKFEPVYFDVNELNL